MTTLAAPTVHLLAADLYRVRVGLEWADVYVWGEGGRRGSLTIQSTLGTYAYTWSNIGDSSYLCEFLAGLDFTYFMQKTRPDYLEFDPVATAKGIAETLLLAWRDGSLPGDMALAGLTLIEHRGLDRITSSDAFHMVLTDTWLAHTLFGDDLSGVARMRPRGECVTFWNDVWPVLCAAWKREAKAPDSCIQPRDASGRNAAIESVPAIPANHRIGA